MKNVTFDNLNEQLLYVKKVVITVAILEVNDRAIVPHDRCLLLLICICSLIFPPRVFPCKISL